MTDEIETLKMHSPDLTQDHIVQIRALFPGCVTEARGEDGKVTLKVDFDQLRQELSDSIVEGPQERYHLNWPGKREALITANAPIAKTLRPCRDESVDFDNTHNLFIEGDNLEALKLLQETYLGKVKMIYIDPPYNTGNDFIYSDNFSVSAEKFDRDSSLADQDGNRLVSNASSNGRFHSDWLSMLFSRLKIAKNLLAEDGLIFVSIDDCEMAGLRLVLDEVFGKSTFVSQFVWKSRVSEDVRAKTGVSNDHEYILCYSKTDIARLKGVEKDTEKFSNTDGDERGPWRSADLTGLATKDARPNLHYDLIDPKTGKNYGCPPKGWRYEPSTMDQKISENRILFPDNPEGRPRHKLFLNEMGSLFKSISSVIQKHSTADGTRELNSLMGGVAFTFPKPTALISDLIEQATGESDIVLDFFAGSGTTADATLKLNSKDGGNRRFIAVQIPEQIDRSNRGESDAARLCDEMGVPRNIAELSKERIRRAGRRLLESVGEKDWNKDVGFRVLKIDSSNMADVFYTPDATSQKDLLKSVDNIKPDRTPEDLLFHVLVDWGVDLTLPISRESIEGKAVFSVAGTALMACFDSGVDEALVTKLAERQPMRVVFKDTGFKDDATKINVRQIFKSLSPDTEVKAI